MTFISMGDSKYYNTIKISIEQSLKFYPNRKFLLYDWGLTQQQLDNVNKYKNIVVLSWKDRIIKANEVFIKNNKSLKFWIKKNILRYPNLIRSYQKWQREFLLDEKCYCILDAAIRLDSEFIFLDADAFIINYINELNDFDVDVVVTLRPLKEIANAKKRNHRHELNSGVIYFGKNKSNNIAFITEWIKEMNLLNLKYYSLSEQTGLSNLILKFDSTAFEEYNKTVNLKIGDQTIRSKIVSTDSYNYNSVENGFDPAINKILHLKSGRGFESLLADVLKKL